MDINLLIQGMFLGILILLSGFFSATETALFSLNRIRILDMADKGHKKAKIILEMLDNPNKLIATILIGNNVVNIGASALATSLFITLFGSTGVGIATGVMTLLVLIFGEVTPKTFATQNAEKWSLGVIKFIKFLSVILTPVIRVMSYLTDMLLKFMGNDGKKAPAITEDELKILVNAGKEEGFIGESQQEMINSIFDFDETIVKEIMVPRIDMVTVDIEQTIPSVIARVIEAGHSRLPVYKDNIDNIVGILYAKDLLKHVYRDLDQLKIKNIMRKPYYIPRTKNIRDLLAELRQAKVHIAIVLDEYGGTAGMVTIEDVLEEIVGEIQDEYDVEEDTIRFLEDGSILLTSRASICDINETLGTDLPEDDNYETISGLVFHYIGHVPKEGQEVKIDNVKIKVEKIVGQRVEKVKLWVV